MRNVALWLHIIGAGLWLGANVVQAVIGPRMVAGGSGLPWLKAVEKASGPMYGAASALTILTGIYLVLASDGGYSFGSLFVGIGIAVVIISGAMAGLVFNRKTKQVIAHYEAGNEAQANTVYKSIGSWGVLDTALIAFAILAMVSKWGA